MKNLITRLKQKPRLGQGLDNQLLGNLQQQFQNVTGRTFS